MGDLMVVHRKFYDALGLAVSKLTTGLCRWDLNKIEGRLNEPQYNFDDEYERLQLPKQPAQRRKDVR